MSIAVIVVIIILIMLFILLFMYKNNNGMNGGLIIDVDPKYSEYADNVTKEVASFYAHVMEYPYEFTEWKYDDTFLSFVIRVHNALIDKFNDDRKIYSFNLMSIIPCLLRIYIDENFKIDSVEIIGCGSFNDVIKLP